MRILLLDPPIETVYSQVQPSLGLAYLSAAIAQAGFEYNVLDLKLYDNWQRVLNKELQEDYDVIGIRATTFEYKSAVRVAGFIKETTQNPKIVLGGSHATLMGVNVLRESNCIDFCIRGEGEYSFVKLIQAIHDEKKYSKIDGLCYKRNNAVYCNPISRISDLNMLPFPDYSKFELEKYASSPNSFGILTSRGCPYGCIYCSVGLLMGKKFRSRTPQNIIKELKYLKTEYGTTIFEFLDDNFTYDINRAKKICKLLLDEKLNISWSLPNGIRVDKIDKELIELMKKSGCIEIAIGIESTKNTILKNLQKGTSMQKIKNTVELITSYDIPVKGFFLIGSPGEVKEDVIEYLDFAKEVGLQEARFNMLTPYPGTKLWEWIDENRLWVVENPFDAVTEYTHIGKVRALYETPIFTAEDKEHVYELVWELWDEYKCSRTLKGKMTLKLKKYPYIYSIVKRTYQLLK